MKAADIRAHLATYSISTKRGTTIRHAFASAIAPVDLYDEQRVRQALTLLGQRDLSALTCVYCDRTATTWDHLQALVRDKRPSGFGHTLGNLVPACRDCNSERGNKPWEAWMVGRGASIERVASIKSYHEAFLAGGTLVSHQTLDPDQAQRLRAIEEQIVVLMAEADGILARARSGSEGGKVFEGQLLGADGETGGGPVTPEPRTKGPVLPGKRAMPILDTKTGKEYRAKAAAGKDLYGLVGGDIKDTWVWFKILRAFPNRFQTKNAAGEWVALDDPSVEPGTTRRGS